MNHIDTFAGSSSRAARVNILGGRNSGTLLTPCFPRVILASFLLSFYFYILNYNC